MINRLLVIAALTLCVVATGPAAAEQARAQAPPPDPDAGLDDTPLGGLDQTDLGQPLDETDLPAVNNPAPPSGAPVSPPAGAPSTGGAPGVPPINVFINVSSGTGGNAAPRRRTAAQRRRAAQRKRARNRRQARHRRHHARGRHHARR
jgi:hypothetical protein